MISVCGGHSKSTFVVEGGERGLHKANENEQGEGGSSLSERSLLWKRLPDFSKKKQSFSFKLLCSCKKVFCFEPSPAYKGVLY